MKDIEDRIQEKYDELEVPEYMFDTSRVFKRVEKENNSSKNRIIYIAASIVAILFIIVTLFYTVPILLKENEANIKEKAISDLVKGQIIITNKIASLNDNSRLVVATIKVSKIIGYEIIESIPYTKIKAQVLNSYLGNLSGEIEMYVPGGIFSIKDIKEKVTFDKIDDITSFKDEDKVRVTYYNSIYIPNAEEGKTYITTLNEIDGKYFVNMNSKYGFKEYNLETNKVTIKDYDEQLDIQKYLDSINL